MRTREEWRHDYANLALGGGNLVILLLGFHLASRVGWQFALALIGATSFLAWLANLRRHRTIADIPTARIASAPQGYIEIGGRGRQPPGETLFSPVNQLPCLWYRYLVERKQHDRWEHVESGVSADTFGVDDGSGMMLVDPEGAEIITSRKQVSHLGEYRKTEWTLIEGETIYVIGEHVTLGGPNAVLDKRADLADLLAEWKRDKATLLTRFDANRDGEISLDEWEYARTEAAKQVERDHLEIRLKDGVHLMRKPGQGRLFLVANKNAAALERRYLLWSWTHLALLLCAAAGLAYLGGSA